MMYCTKGGKDVEHFTAMYNAVYDAVKAARLKVRIGGPYLPMGGRDVSADDRQVIDYWRQDSRGADFFAFDGWLEGWPSGGKTEDWRYSRRLVRAEQQLKPFSIFHRFDRSATRSEYA